jgi:hypothetical protein
VIAHIRYSEQRYRTAAECLEAIRSFLARGWWLSAVERRGSSYVATFGVDDTPTEEPR